MKYMVIMNSKESFYYDQLSLQIAATAGILMFHI